MKYAVVTFGCRVNQADSLQVEAALSSCGGEPVSADRADLVVVNTCSVTASADQGARQTIRRIARENPSARIVATGCYATRCASDVAALPGVAAIIPNEDKDSPRFMAALLDQAGRPLDVAAGPCGRPTPGLMGRTAWTLRAQTGCEERCSYCVIPSTRGASRSRTLEEILRRSRSSRRRRVQGDRAHGRAPRVVRARPAAAAVIGRPAHEPRGADPVASRDHRSVRSNGCSFASVRSSRWTAGLKSLTSSHSVPKETPSLRASSSRRTFTCPCSMPQTRFCSACGGRTHGNSTPRSSTASGGVYPMRRSGPTSWSDSRVKRKRISRFSTTICSASPLTHLHVFPYSERPGTDAATYSGKVSGVTIKQRAERVRAISRQLQERFRAAQCGTRRPALTIDDGGAAVTDNYIKVPIEGGCTRNEWVSVIL